MKKKYSIICCCLLIIVLTLSSCSNLPTSEDSPTPDVNATVEAALAATNTASANMQATIDSAVAATTTAIPPLPTPTLVDPTAMNEQEMAAAIESSVEEATTTSEQAAESTYEAMSDGTLTEEEWDEIYYLYNIADEEIEQALELAELYLELYYMLGEETIELATVIVEDLENLASYADTAITNLEEFKLITAAGDEITEERLQEFLSNSENIETWAESLQIQSDSWETAVADRIENLATELQNLEANQIASNRLEAAALAMNYVNEIRSALTDEILTPEELRQIAQFGANASASLEQFGFGELGNLSASIDELTGQLAVGEIEQALNSLNSLESMLP